MVVEERAGMIRDIREFNRFYTNILGLLDRHILDSGYSLTEARILYELNDAGRCIANTLVVRLQLDKSYLSRILAGFERKGLVRREASGDDGRAYTIELTAKGSEAFQALNAKSDEQIRQLLLLLTDAECGAVHAAMETVQKHLTKAKSVTIRPFTQSDIPYVTDRQIDLYEREYGFTSPVWKQYVRDAVQLFVDRYDNTMDCMYMLEHRGALAGCIAVAHAEDRTAQLRFFFLDETVRGMGIGGRLMDLAMAFCKENGYRHVFLWTCNKLDAARYLYKKYGFHITDTQENAEWGAKMVEERWDREIQG